MKLGHTVEESRAKYPELTNEILDELREWGEEHGLSNIPDEQLALFAHSCYYDKEDSIRCMEVYYRLRATTPEFFKDRDPKTETLQHSLKALYVFLHFPPSLSFKLIIRNLFVFIIFLFLNLSAHFKLIEKFIFVLPYL